MTATATGLRGLLDRIQYQLLIDPRRVQIHFKGNRYIHDLT